MREPPDPLRHASSMNLDTDDSEDKELRALTSRLRDAQRRGFYVGSEEQGETASREQVEAQEAIDDFWRRVAARQVDGAGNELKAWNAWRDSGGRKLTVRVDLNQGQMP